jgi:hypothetical protein
MVAVIEAAGFEVTELDDFPFGGLRHVLGTARVSGSR